MYFEVGGRSLVPKFSLAETKMWEIPIIQQRPRVLRAGSSRVRTGQPTYSVIRKHSLECQATSLRHLAKQPQNLRLTLKSRFWIPTPYMQKPQVQEFSEHTELLRLTHSPLRNNLASDQPHILWCHHRAHRHIAQLYIHWYSSIYFKLVSNSNSLALEAIIFRLDLKGVKRKKNTGWWGERTGRHRREGRNTRETSSVLIKLTQNLLG